MKPDQFDYKDPFFGDVFSKELIKKRIDSNSIKTLELAISYGCPWGQCFEYLKNQTFAKCIADLAPHNVQLSREEHLRFGGSYPYPHLTNDFLFKEMYLKHLKLADAVIVHSKQSAGYIEKEADIPYPHIIPHGAYIPEQIPDMPEKFTCGHFGSIGFDKGFHYLLEAIGKQPLVLGGYASSHIALNPDNKNIEVLGAVQDISEFYKKINVLIQSTVTEGFGISGLETLSFGRPVITTEATGVADIITDGVEGFIVPIRDSKKIHDCIVYLADNPSELVRMGRNARNTSLKYSWDKIKKQYVDSITEVLSDG
jgi:glycosyltransferase involved in cell wall biosynthesis